MIFWPDEKQASVSPGKNAKVLTETKYVQYNDRLLIFFFFLQKVHYLKEIEWLNPETRAVFVEFNLYNSAINMFAVSYILFEFMPTGGELHVFGTVSLAANISGRDE